MTVLESLYQVLNQFSALIIEFKTDSFYFFTGIRDKLKYNGEEITGNSITIKEVKSFTVQDDKDEPDTQKCVAITFDDCSTVKIWCM